MLKNNAKNKVTPEIHGNGRRWTQLSFFPIQERLYNKWKQVWNSVEDFCWNQVCKIDKHSSNLVISSSALSQTGHLGRGPSNLISCPRALLWGAFCSDTPERNTKYLSGGKCRWKYFMYEDSSFPWRITIFSSELRIRFVKCYKHWKPVHWKQQHSEVNRLELYLKLK